MKKYTLIIFSLTLFLFSCTDMNDNIKEYYDRGEINYITMVDSVVVNSGKERARFSWIVANDPRIEYCNFTWNDGLNSTQVKIDRTLLDEDNYYSTIIEELEEGTHIFYMYHSGTKGYDSMSEEKVVTVYGEKYISNLTSRRVRNITIENDIAILQWGGVNDDVSSSTVIYENNSGVKKEVIIYPDETETKIDDFVLGDTFIVRTDYQPQPDMLDIFSITSDPIIFRTTGPIDYDRSDWGVSVSHPLPPESGNNRGECIIDGDDSSFLSMIKPGHSMDGIKVEESEDVHFIIDLKEAKEVDYFRLVHRNTNISLRFWALSVYGSDDGENFTVIQQNINIPDADVSAVTDGGNVRITNSKHRYYKFTFTKWQNGTAPGQINEFYLGYIVE